MENLLALSWQSGDLAHVVTGTGADVRKLAEHLQTVDDAADITMRDCLTGESKVVKTAQPMLDAENAGRFWQMGVAGRLDGVEITYRAWMACRDERRALETRRHKSPVTLQKIEELIETEGTRRGQYVAARADALLWIAQNPAPAAAVAEVRAMGEENRAAVMK